MTGETRLIIEALFGTSEGRALAARSRKLARSVADRLGDFQTRFPVDDTDCLDAAPVFILSAGWLSRSILA